VLSGGWDNLEGSDSEESEETDEDDYQPSEAEDESDDYDSEYSDDESGSEYYGSAGAEEEESGEDWDELERKAAAEDRQTFGGAYSDEENDKVIILFVQCYALTWTYCCAR
jgi:nucleosome binding factor SPN SPT16 subunit